jgi:hypothetical protein
VSADIFRALAAPFEPSRVSWRVGSTNKEKTKGMALAYIDARGLLDADADAVRRVVALDLTGDGVQTSLNGLFGLAAVGGIAAVREKLCEPGLCAEIDAEDIFAAQLSRLLFVERRHFVDDAGATAHRHQRLHLGQLTNRHPHGHLRIRLSGPTSAYAPTAALHEPGCLHG